MARQARSSISRGRFSPAFSSPGTLVGSYSIFVTAVPEPASLVLLMTGFGALFARRHH